MNPSSNGWIPKLLNQFSQEDFWVGVTNTEDFYELLRNTGFLYGISTHTLLKKPISNLKLTKEEYTKVNLFHALLFTYLSTLGKNDSSQAIEEMVSFYETIEKGKPGFFQKLSFSKKASDTLEKILSARLQESNAYLKTDVATLFTYALLYVDVLAFQYYLTHKSGLKDYLKGLEETIIQFSIWALESKLHKSKYDLLVIEMVSESATYDAATKNPFNHETSVLLKERSLIEKKYVFEICCLATWDDRKLDQQEIEFLKKLATYLALPTNSYIRSIGPLADFAKKNAKKIQLFEYSHPVKQFYKQSTKTVKLLILRNKNRLIQEINESGELLVLLSTSTLRELNPEEKSKVKNQLLDICKTIPSLTIFLLPGGTLLLPLLVKLIPKLLPSAFHENRLKDNK